jgi:hypothetical protein
MSGIEAKASFDIPAGPEEAWVALESLRARASDQGEWWLPGFEARCGEVEADRPHSLTVRKLDQPCAGTLIAVTFEHLDTGSRIRVVQSGFDERFVEAAGDAFWSHAEVIFAGVRAFFEAVTAAEAPRTA